MRFNDEPGGEMFGPGGISVWQLLIILVIVVLIFGTKKIRGMGTDLGSAVKGFKKSVQEAPTEEEESKESLEDAAAKVEDEGVETAEKEKA